jgi:hypothetical protein
MIKCRRLRWAGHVAGMEEGRNAFKILRDKHTGKILLRRLRRIWEDNIRMDLKEIGVSVRSVRSWIESAQDSDCWKTLVNAAFNLRVFINNGVS